MILTPIVTKKKKKKPKSKLQKKRENTCSLYWRNKADAAWKAYIRHAFGFRCAICGKSEGKLDTHHLVSRDILHMRHDPDNGILLCVNHHFRDREVSAHKGTIGFIVWIMANRPLQWAYVSENCKIPEDWDKNYEEEAKTLNNLLLLRKSI